MLITETRLRETIQRILLEVDEAKMQKKLAGIAKVWKTITENEPFANKKDPEALFEMGRGIHMLFGKIANFPDSRDIAKRHDKRRKDKSHLKNLKALKGKTKEDFKSKTSGEKGAGFKLKRAAAHLERTTKRLLSDIKEDEDIMKIIDQATGGSFEP